MAGVLPVIFFVSLTRSSAASRTHSGSPAGTSTVAVSSARPIRTRPTTPVCSDRRARVQTSCFMVFVSSAEQYFDLLSVRPESQRGLPPATKRVRQAFQPDQSGWKA